LAHSTSKQTTEGAGLRTPDPLGYNEPLPFFAKFFPLGFPLVLKTNSRDIVEAGRESWAEFGAAFEVPPVELRVMVQGDEAELTRTSPAGPRFRAQAYLLSIVLDEANFAVCDLGHGLGFASLTPGVARNQLYTAFHFLDAMACLCLCHQHVTPIHAACVASRGKGILLVGAPGAGKSSLAWACARAGLTLVSDDALWMPRRQATLTLIGKPQRMRFRPEAIDLFPELKGIRRLDTVIGKSSFEIRTADVPGLATAACCRPGKVLFLDRQSPARTELFPICGDEARQCLAEATTRYESSVWEEQEASRERLVRCGAFRLRYSNLHEAVQQIFTVASQL
jgi:hypothetical protein